MLYSWLSTETTYTITVDYTAVMFSNDSVGYEWYYDLASSGKDLRNCINYFPENTALPFRFIV
jgi:hypothetical protein